MSGRKLLIASVIFIMSLFSVISLSSFFEKKHVPVYVYGTDKFEEREKELMYSQEEAIDIYCRYAFDDLQKDSLSFYTYILYDNEYVFTSVPYNAKMGYCYLNGYWVNGETGFIKEQKSGKYIKILIEGHERAIHISKDQFQENGGSAFSKET